jgi:hypothetical protein
MSYRYLFLSVALAGLLAVTGFAHATQGSHNRDPHVCSGGSNIGQPCIDNSQCPQSKCEVNYLSGPGTTFHAELTIIVDDDVSQWDSAAEPPNVVAVTILLKTRSKGKEHLLAQTYQNLAGGDLATLIENLQKGPVIADSANSDGKNIEESDLINALDPAHAGTTMSLLDDLLWQNGDSDMVEELRRIFAVTGTPVLAETPKTLAGVKDTICPAVGGCQSAGLASVARLKVTFRFVAP